MQRKTPWLAALVIALAAAPANSQAQETTRAAAAQAARESKATTPFRPGKVERFLTKLEQGGMLSRVFTPADGFGVRIGGIESGSGFALGPSWRESSPFGGNMQLSISGARGLFGDTQIDAGLAFPHVGTHRLSIGLDAMVSRLPQERYFGTSVDSQQADETAFALNRDRIAARVTFAPINAIRLSASAGTLNATTAAGRSRIVPSIESRFSAQEAPGLGAEPRFATLSLAATVDYRDMPGNPRRGGRYHLAVDRYADQSLQRYSFTRIDAELEQHVSVWQRQRVLTVRAMASATIADEGNDVPFYLQPALGGSRVLRGFVTDRFRDRNVVALQAEYGWDLLPFVSAVAFAEAGTTAARWQELDTQQLRKDYGIGLRFGSARTVALRTDVAFGSGEGTRLTMRFNHAF